MTISVGTPNIAKIALGSTNIAKVSVGTALVFPSAPSAPVNLTYLGSRSGTSGTIPYTTGVQAGDVAVFLENMPVGAVARIPAGFTEIVDLNLSGNNGRLEASFRILTAGDIGGGVALVGVAGILMIYRGYDATDTVQVPITTVTSSRLVFDGSVLNPNPIIITPKAINSLSQSFACYASSASIFARAYTGGTPDQELGGTVLYTKTRSYKTAIASNITVDMNDVGAYNLLCAFDITAT